MIRIPLLPAFAISLGILTLGAVPSAPAQQASAPAATPQVQAAPTDSASRAAVAAMKNELRNLVVAQERYRHGAGAYASDIAAIWGASPGPARPNDAVILVVTHANERSWRARAEHRALPGRSCVIFIGEASDFPLPVTKAQQIVPTAEQAGRPICDPL